MADLTTTALAAEAGLKLGVCRYGCGRPVMWAPIRDETGRAKISTRTHKPSVILLDVTKSDRGEFALVAGGGAVTPSRGGRAGRQLFTSHFKTCPNQPTTWRTIR